MHSGPTYTCLMQTSRTYTDQMNRNVEIPQPVRRIVSLVPSQSELLADLGLTDLLEGVTKFCVHPAELREKVQQIGGTKTVKIDKVLELKPDLVIGNKEENLQSDIEALEQHVPVWMSDITDLASALEMIRQVGLLTGTAEAADQLAAVISLKFSELTQEFSEHKKLRTLYLIWKKPYMAAGTGTFIDDCLSRCGLVNCLEEKRYPVVAMETIDPEVILLSSEPYPFAEKHITELQEQFPQAKILLADGEYFSWYGSRMLGAPDYFRKLLKELHTDQ